MNTFHEEKRYLINNPPKGIASNSWVMRTADYGNKTITKGKKYQVRNYFRYLNTYGSKGERYPKWDEFIIIKNDEGWTVKMNLIGFEPCDAPLNEIQELKKRVAALESNCQTK